PTEDAMYYVNLTRERAGLPTVEYAWTTYSSDPDKYKTADGFREIIHRERLIELALEAQRFWDLRRWKSATREMNKPITGWDVEQELPEFYYREVTIFSQKFTTRDYLWPINESELLRNRNLVQNPGW